VRNGAATLNQIGPDFELGEAQTIYPSKRKHSTAFCSIWQFASTTFDTTELNAGLQRVLAVVPYLVSDTGLSFLLATTRPGQKGKLFSGPTLTLEE
jgi:hypothetical protein